MMKLDQEISGIMSMEPIMNIEKREGDMEDSIRKLRFDFEAETDIIIDKSPEDWQKYAKWLERLTINEMNNRMIKENTVLKDMMQEALNVLQEGIVNRID